MDRSFISSEPESLQASLTCYLCAQLFRRPRVLPCGHTFCSDCLVRLKADALSDSSGEKIELEKSEVSDLLESQANSLCDETDGLSSNGIGDKGDLGPPRKFSSSCVDDILDNVDSSWYRPQSSQEYGGRAVSSQALDYTPKRLTRSSTFVTSKSSMWKERSPSRTNFTPASKRRTSPSACSHCGNVWTVAPGTGNATPVSRSPGAGRVKPGYNSPRDVSSSPSRQGPTSGSPRWDSSARGCRLSPPACAFEHRHGRELGQLTCPIPDCAYSMRIMNLARWSPRNKALADVTAVWRRQRENLQDASTQTDISNDQSMLVSIPRSLVDQASNQTLGGRRRHSSMMDIALSQASNMDGLQTAYIPPHHFSWRSYAAMLGMNILQQVVNL